MHPNKAFRQTPHDKAAAFARDRGFGMLAVNAPQGPLLSHVPFLLSDDGTRLEAHLVRANPMTALLDTPRPAVMAVSGPDSYVSPDWYGIDDQVPTWNYIAVHVHGTLELLDASALRGILERFSAAFEERLLPKPPWTLDKVSDETYRKLALQIVPVAMTVDSIDSTWKLAQNKTDAARTGAADGVGSHDVGSETGRLAAYMKEIEHG